MSQRALHPDHTFSGPAFLRHRCEAAEPRANVVFVHGLGESGLCFEKIWNDPLLAPYRLFSWDLPGYGKSAWTESPTTIPEHAEFLRERLEETLSGDPLDTLLVGHSMGGVIGQFLCESETESEAKLVDRLVNVEGNLSLSDCTLSARAAGQSLEVWCRVGQQEAADVLYLEGVHELASRTYYASLKVCDPRVLHQNSCELVELSRGEQLAQRMGRLTIPRDYVYGDPGGTGTHSRGLLHEAGVAAHGVSHSGHWPFIDHPDQFLKVLISIFEG